MKTDFDELRREIEDADLQTEDDVERFRVRFLGQKQGRIKQLFGKIGSLEPEERPAFGKHVNALKQQAETRLAEARARLDAESQPQAAELDLTLPGRRPFAGSVHPLTQTRAEITQLFERMGFSVAEGPEIEDGWHNFTALNFPPDHPARDMQDTFFLDKNESRDSDALLRTHTSPMQIRVLQRQEPPVRVAVPGRVYRNEAISYKSFCLFHQVEGLYVDENVSMTDLKGTLTRFVQAFFGENTRMRFRPSFFPFTEPSAEVDIWWADDEHPNGGQWLEILGSGMVHPNVLEAAGVDPERYTGYAFGIGIERMAMLRYDIDDIRLFYENDVRFLEQF